MTMLNRVTLLSLLGFGLSAGTFAQAQKPAASKTSNPTSCTAAQTKQAQADEQKLQAVKRKDEEAKAAYEKAVGNKKKASADDKATTQALVDAYKTLAAADDEYQAAFTAAQHTAACRPSK